MAQRIVDVLVPVALDHAYSYRVPAGTRPCASAISSRCRSGTRETLGVVWADNVPVRPGLHNRLKDVEAKLDYPPLRDELRHFVDWVANYTLGAARHGAAHGACAWASSGPERERVGVRLAGPPPQRMTPARRRVLAALADGLLRTKTEAAKDAGVSTGVIDGLVDEGTLEVVALPPEPVARQPDPDFREPELTGAAAHGGRHPARRRARKAASRSTCSTASPARARPKSISRRSPRRSGSGRQSLILMPEIALTAQFLDRFAAALRRASGRMAFGARAAQARAHLERGRGGRGERRGRRALGAVSALCGSRPDRGR